MGSCPGQLSAYLRRSAILSHFRKFMENQKSYFKRYTTHLGYLNVSRQELIQADRRRSAHNTHGGSQEHCLTDGSPLHMSSTPPCPPSLACSDGLHLPGPPSVAAHLAGLGFDACVLEIDALGVTRALILPSESAARLQFVVGDHLALIENLMFASCHSMEDQWYRCCTSI